ncbi:hypothetical protein D6D19_10476 [Aureobasidium pullulans]|uniref:Acyl-coenzyme A diphosphatase SCS3 n=2 Tax=Aureobasidium pullulans TaxID=5580 RepID=A0A4S9KX14_AURPU|nr:hypothetical protein D6D19_10476 [Aureobasidium pullulans]THW79341.1 hypothetical protein D6D17_09977 [Aureobasidium pullulans]THY21137.1 hypothetical protein D6D00_07374 [Aureobasidium pullulans]
MTQLQPTQQSSIHISAVMSVRNRVKAEVPVSSMSSPYSASSPNGNLNRQQNAQSSPWYPTFLEAILLAIYPFTLVLGSLFSVLNTTTRNTPYSGDLQSHPPSIAPSYFALKSNVFNVYFVKIGWFWITGAFFLFCFTHSSLGPRFKPTLTARRARALIRYTAVTAVWCAVTQWFFGPPIIDRGFRLTGGQCAIIYNDDPINNAKQNQMSDTREIFTHAACKIAGGSWRGGHDISGHVFILILGSAMLWLEILPDVLRNGGLREDRRIRMHDGAVKTAAVETHDEKGNVHVPSELGLGVRVALCIAGLSWWMLLMTAAYFHTWLEKFTGFLVAFGVIYAVYFVPRGVPALRSILGMPGV